MGEKVDVPLTSMVVSGAVLWEGTEEDRQAILAKQKPEPVYYPKWIAGVVDEGLSWAPWLDVDYDEEMPLLMARVREKFLAILQHVALSEQDRNRLVELWLNAEWQ